MNHFIEACHAYDAFQFLVLEIITPNLDEGGDPLIKLAQRETFWIHRVCIMQPKGLNTVIDFAPFLWVLIGNTWGCSFKECEAEIH